MQKYTGTNRTNSNWQVFFFRLRKQRELKEESGCLMRRNDESRTAESVLAAVGVYEVVILFLSESDEGVCSPSWAQSLIVSKIE